jgi:hypothetical protein
MTNPARPQPVLDAAKVGGLVSAAVIGVGGAVFLIIGGVTSENLSAVGIAVGGGVTALVALATYLFSLAQGRKAAEQVTPLSKPQDAAGRALVPDPDIYGRHARRPTIR